MTRQAKGEMETEEKALFYYILIGMPIVMFAIGYCSIGD